MDTPSLRKRIGDLQTTVAPYSNGSIPSGFFAFPEYLSSPKLYIIIPIAIFFLLLFSRPSFIIDDVIGRKPSLSIKKLLMFWLIISGVLVLGLFGYNYKLSQS